MNVLVGLVALAIVLVFSLDSGRAQFTGLLYRPALVLVTLAPLCIAVISFKAAELRNALKYLLIAMRFDAVRSRTRLYDDLLKFATEARARRTARALELAEGSSHELVRRLAPLVAKGHPRETIEETAATATYLQASALKRAEDVLTTLARVAPATGLVGTVLGLINLLKDLAKFDQLGPSMALALLCTLYGLLLANALFQPLARLVHARCAVLLEESKLVVRALAYVSENRPIADLRALFDEPVTDAPATPPVLEKAAG